MARLVFTDPQLEALKAGWNAGSSGIPDDRWVAVQVALDLPPPAGIGAVEVDLDERAERDLREGFASAFEAGIADDPGHAAMAEALAGVAQVLEIAPAPAFGY